jgi:predicted nucleic-acid-binding protein
VIVDTNVLLRALDRDASAHAKAVHLRVEGARASGETFTVLSATVLEMVYVLESSRAGYGWDREFVAQAVQAVIDEPAFDVEHSTALRAAATSYRAQSVDLHDCFLSAIAHERHTRVLSFGQDLRRLGNSEEP